MTRRMTPVRRGPALPAAAIIALLLAGCSSGHVGDSWQCPLATGGACDSVAAADPAVPVAKAGRDKAPGQPLWLLPRETMPDIAEAQPKETRPCAGDCDFDPFGWLARLFRVEAPEPETRPEPAEPAAGPLPAEAAPDEDGPGGGSRRADDLRTGEVVARIWIAPFVDANGVYREASHVRVVLEPAGWRLP